MSVESVRAAALSALFVFLWSTGFVVAKYAAPHADPLTFLVIRFAGAVAFLSLIAAAANAHWPRGRRAWGHQIVIGLLVHGLYLGGVWAAVARGMPAGVAAMIVSLQPILTAVLSGPVLGEPVRRLQWIGLTLGLIGAAMVLSDKLDRPGGDIVSVALAVMALCGITAGTMWQKRFGAATDLRTGTAVQYAASGLALAVIAPMVEPLRVEWTVEFVAALLWATVMLSFVAITLFYRLVRDGTAAKVVALLFLVPPVTALMAWAMFGEALSPFAVVGIVVVAIGVAVATRPSPRGA